jgi:hypothetical protein
MSKNMSLVFCGKPQTGTGYAVGLPPTWFGSSSPTTNICEFSVQAGTIDQYSAQTQSGDSTTDIVIWIDGVADTTLSDIGAGVVQATVSIATTEGGTVAVEYDGGTSPVDSVHELNISSSVDAFVIFFGSNLTIASAGVYVTIQSSPSAGGASSSLNNYQTETQFVGGNISRFLLQHSAGDTTTDYIIWVNGAADTTVSNVGSGLQSISVSTTIIEGQEIACEYDGGTNPGQTHIVFIIEPSSVTAQQTMWWGSSCNAGNYFFAGCDGGNGVGSANAYDVEHVVHFDSSTLEKLSIFSASADGTSDLVVWVNGVADTTLSDIGSASQTLTVNSSGLSATDVVRIEFDGGTTPGASSMHLNVSGVESSSGEELYVEDSSFRGVLRGVLRGVF